MLLYLVRLDKMLWKLGHVKNTTSYTQFQLCLVFFSCSLYNNQQVKIEKSECTNIKTLTVSLFHIFMIRESAEIIKSN